MAEAFFTEMVRLGRALRGPPIDLAPWVELGRRLVAEEQRDLIRFCERVVADPDRLRVVWMGRTALARQRLSRPHRAMLDVLGHWPDLFEPSRSRWDEVAHTETIAWLLGRSKALRDRFFELLLRAEPYGAPLPIREDLEANSWLVLPERCVQGGRVDVWLESAKTVVLVEAKLGAPEGAEQIPRFVSARARHSRGRAWHVVFLTLDPDQRPSGPAIGITFERLLVAWLPIAVAGHEGFHAHLRAYLATLARLCSVGRPSDFDDWEPAERRRAIDLVRQTWT